MQSLQVLFHVYNCTQSLANSDPSFVGDKLNYSVCTDYIFSSCKFTEFMLLVEMYVVQTVVSEAVFSFLVHNDMKE